MDSTKPFKVVKVPTGWGVCWGYEPAVLHECESRTEADALRYQEWIDDDNALKTMLYCIEVVEFRSQREPIAIESKAAKI